MKERRLIIIAATGRSGTTWIQNILSAPLNYRLIFEPLHPRVSGAGGYWRWHLEAGDVDEKMYGLMDDAVHGRINSRWMKQGGQEKLRYFCRNRWWAGNTVVKIIRGNLMLDWLEKNFPCSMVYMVRHPCAVIASKLKIGWGKRGGGVIEHMLSQDALMERHLGPYRHIIETKNETLAQRHALLWCMENKVPLNQFRDHRWVGCVYEYLYLRPREELERIYSELGMPMSSKSYRMVNKISHTSRGDSAVRTGEDVLRKWQKELTEEEVDQIMEIVEAFGMGIYDRGEMPVASEVERLMGIKSPL